MKERPGNYSEFSERGFVVFTSGYLSLFSYRALSTGRLFCMSPEPNGTKFGANEPTRVWHQMARSKRNGNDKGVTLIAGRNE